MRYMEPDDEFAEFDTTEDEIDAMMAAGEPVDIWPLTDVLPDMAYPVVRSIAQPTFAGGCTVVRQLTTWAPSVHVAGSADHLASVA